MEQLIYDRLQNIIISDWDHAHDKTFLEDHDIKTVIHCTDEWQTEAENKVYNDLNIPLYNYPFTENENIGIIMMTELFKEANKQINYVISNNEKVLVHCYAGVNRSVSVVIYYLMMNIKCTPEQALSAIIKIRRPQAEPEPEYWSALNEIYNMTQHLL